MTHKNLCETFCICSLEVNLVYLENMPVIVVMIMSVWLAVSMLLDLLSVNTPKLH